MSTIETPFPLERGENCIEVRDLIDGDSLTSDGNSRWVDHEDKRYFIVNGSYKAPKES